ncbi:MAG: N-methylproline demethylase [Alphaproteobacteria bacterium]|nr:N-methylproline demethylase [Alphaproteobacteria bacterium]
MSNDPLLQPFKIKHLTLRNRLMTTSHEPAYPEDGMPKGRYRAYHVERAKAGLALTMTAGSAAVAQDSPPVFNNILAYKDEVVKWMKELTDECHEYGAAVMIQLTHLGRRTRWDKADWLPAVAPTNVREPAHRAVPKIVEDWDIERIIGNFADAAERMKEAGVDGIEFESFGHLLSQFWSPMSNQLDNQYGGSLENRVRFSLEVLEAVRKRVGPELILGIRYCAEELSPDGYDLKDGIAISNMLKSSGLIDFLNVTRGHIDTDPGLTDNIPIMGMASAPHLQAAGEIRAATKFPVFHATRIQDVATARFAVASGKVDMVGMTRAHLADPHIVRKIMENREHDIRPCTGANYCLDRIYQGAMAVCIHNPSTGREETMPHDIPKAKEKKKIVVVGAGPAGLEAARVGAERGHDVIVLEAAAKAGGQILLTAQSPMRKEMMAIADWRLAQCEARGVTFQYNIWAESDTVTALNPDVVVIATGGLPHTGSLREGADLVVTSWDILSGDVKPGSNVLMYDEAGDHSALQSAEIIAETGAKLEIMTRDRSFAPEVMAMSLTPHMRALQKHDVKFTVTYLLEKVRREGNQLVATIGSDYGGISKEQTHDQVVVNYGTLANDELYFALKPLSSNLGAVDHQKLIAGQPQDLVKNKDGKFQLFRIGDAVASRNTHAAIYDALRLVRYL